MRADLATVLTWMIVGLAALFAINVILGLVDRHGHHRRLGPAPPVNVRVRTRWGTEIPVQCVYVGRVDGIHRWEVIRPAGIANPGDVAQVQIGVLPPKTAVALFRAEETDT